MDIMRATIHDIDGLVKIRLEYLNEDTKGLTKEQTDKLIKVLPCYYKEHLDNDFTAYIAKEKDEIVSSVFLVILEKPANPNFLTGKIGNILNVFTKPEYRRKGLAGKLLDMAIEDATLKDVSYIELMATQDGYPLYKKKRFIEAKSKCTPMQFIIK